jgi:hypothetical protein
MIALVGMAQGHRWISYPVIVLEGKQLVKETGLHPQN